jgi:hypothetical protein
MAWCSVKAQGQLRLFTFNRGLTCNSYVRNLAYLKKFSPYHRVKNGSRAHPASYQTGTRGSFPGDKAAGAWSWPIHLHLVPRSIMRGAIPPLPQWHGARLKKKHRDNLTFNFTPLMKMGNKFTCLTSLSASLQSSRFSAFSSRPAQCSRRD